MIEGFDWRNPDYTQVYEDRVKRLTALRTDKTLVAGVKEYYSTRPAEFIADWMVTVDPRNVERGIPSEVPFLLFPKQIEFVNWIVERWRSREDFVVEKSRDMGASWLTCAIAVWMWLFHTRVIIGFGSRKESYVDAIGNPASLFWKIRAIINNLPAEFQPKGWNEKTCAPFMRIINPENASSITGEAGDNIGRGARTSIYFVDEAAFLEHPDAIDAALSQTSNCKGHISTPNGAGNPFYVKRHSGKYPVFVFDWRDDPRKDADWYAKQCSILDPVIVAQEIDRNYEASVNNVFIQGGLVRAAMQRGPADVHPHGGLRVGVDVARFGDDKSVITFRRGRALLKQVALAQLDVVQVAARVKSEIAAFREMPEQIAVDTIGIGSGVADTLRAWFPDKIDRATQRKIRIVVDVNSSLRMSNGEDYNLRAFMWREMREWLQSASIPNDNDLKTDLTALQYTFKGGELLIESKDDAKRRGIKSPDRADSLAMTFAVPTIVSKAPRVDVQPFRPSAYGTGAL